MGYSGVVRKESDPVLKLLLRELLEASAYNHALCKGLYLVLYSRRIDEVT